MIKRGGTGNDLGAPTGRGTLSCFRRGHSKRALSAVAVGLAAGVLLAGAPAPAGAVTSDQRSAAQAAAKQAAKKFLRISRCPLTFQGAKVVGEVTKANRKKVVKRVIKNTLLAKGSNGVCTAVVGIPSASHATANYRSVVHAQTAPGNLLVRLLWRDPSTGKVHQTLAVMSKRAKLKFESLLDSYSRPAPAKVPMPPTARTSVASTRSVATHRFYWRPWVGVGYVCVALNGYGRCVVYKVVSVDISVDSLGNITATGGGAGVETAFGYRATKQETTRLVNRGGVQCWEVTVSISWTDIIGTMTGTNKQVYTLCADGTHHYSSE